MQMKTIIEVALRLLLLLPMAFAAPAIGDKPAPDALVKAISDEVIATVRQDKDIQSGDPAKIAALVETKILPHFDFARTTRIAMGSNWRRATPEQQERLTREFRDLLVRTYSTALTTYRDQRIDIKPLRARPGDTQVTVRTEVRQTGSEPVSIDYDMENTSEGWKVFDIRIAGASLAATYRDSFSETVRNIGVDGLIELLSIKNRRNAAKPAAVQT
jgi:phospholipid transport system substrate-binding protein